MKIFTFQKVAIKSISLIWIRGGLTNGIFNFKSLNLMSKKRSSSKWFLLWKYMFSWVLDLELISYWILPVWELIINWDLSKVSHFSLFWNWTFQIQQQNISIITRTCLNITYCFTSWIAGVIFRQTFIPSTIFGYSN